MIGFELWWRIWLSEQCLGYSTKVVSRPFHCMHYDGGLGLVSFVGNHPVHEPFRLSELPSQHNGIARVTIVIVTIREV